MKNLLRLIFIITMGILLTGGNCGEQPDPAPPEEPTDSETKQPDPPPKEDPPPPPPEPVVEEPKPVEVEETVEVQKSAEVQKAVEEEEAEVVIAQQQEVVKEEAQIAVEQDAEKSVEAPKAVTIISAPPEESDVAIYDLEMVYFAYDKSIITTAFGEALQKNYEWIAENPDVQIQLEGHCDERGTNEYNLALGERRAKAVFDYLISLGASASQFSLVSFGEERPADQGSNEVAWRKNRRVEFTRL
jgi:peptidoglycan-associated lipoprotein